MPLWVERGLMTIIALICVVMLLRFIGLVLFGGGGR